MDPRQKHRVTLFPGRELRESRLPMMCCDVLEQQILERWRSPAFNIGEQKPLSPYSLLLSALPRPYHHGCQVYPLTTIGLRGEMLHFRAWGFAFVPELVRNQEVLNL